MAEVVDALVSGTSIRKDVQVVNLDLAVEDLLERLKSGRIYAPDKVAGEYLKLLGK